MSYENHIHRNVAEFYSVDSQKMKETSGAKTPYTIPRYISMYLMREINNTPHSAIKQFYNADQVVHANKWVNSYLNDPNEVMFQMELSRLEKIIVGSWDLQKLSLQDL